MTDETMVSLAEVEASLIKHMNYEGEARLYRIMAELTPKPKPEYVPELGEVFCFRKTVKPYNSLAPKYLKFMGAFPLDDCEYARPLTTSEVPGYKIAVEALKKVIAQFDGDTEGYIDISKVREALFRIKEMGGDGE